MIARNKLDHYLKTLLQPENFQDYAPNGLQVEGCEKITRLAVSPSISTRVISEAIAGDAEAILVHHGLYWNNTSACAVGPMKKRLKLLLENDISLFAYHLPLDFSPEYGNNRPVLELLNLSEIESFKEIGYIGKTPAPWSQNDFFNQIEKLYNSPGTHIFPENEQEINRVAIVSGGGASYFQAAIDAGADAFITGEGTEWAYHMARENEVTFSAMGHYTTEMVGPRLIGEHLKERFDLEVTIVEEKNPF